MKRRRRLNLLVIPLLLLLAGCQTHLVFVEEHHVGLKAKFTADGTAPANLDVGMQRGVFAMIPQTEGNRSEDQEGYQKQEKVGNTTVIKVKPGNGELTSLYNTFEANVGLFDPIEVKHFVATGIAASYIAADPKVLEYLWQEEADR